MKKSIKLGGHSRALSGTSKGLGHTCGLNLCELRNGAEAIFGIWLMNVISGASEHRMGIGDR